MKITRATIKKFIKENFAKDTLYIKRNSSFNGMIDCVDDSCATGIEKAKKDMRDGALNDNSLGVLGAWFVGQSRDYLVAYENENFIGYEVYNCCGSFILLTKK